MTGLVDTHAHLMDAAFDGDRDAVVRRAASQGVAAMLLVGYDLVSSRAAVTLARALPSARASVGIHPNSAAEHSDVPGAAFEHGAEHRDLDLLVVDGEDHGGRGG